ncbi:YeeE/YedE family protein [Salipiger sp. CCB-MM3]|uniref:YeeE/YedE family protein n=1 Tax=Salipiger sp. CCB-MM3 TaxID=1792508 RepID=UPI00080AA07A|nr:YeeE/YedE family protein [Salipiger sp. CCB-MM3]ANT59222.1 YeeE/YedE family protein [Salipiger sp. CCB-MM3]
MFDFGDGAAIAALAGLFGGIVLGLAARLGRFCTLGAIEDALYSSDSRRLRMWGVAIGTAILCTHVALAAGWIDPAQTFFLSRQWSLPATVIGGLVFGYGMALSGNCGYGALARLGGGDLRSLVIVVVMGLTAYITISGPLAFLRVAVFPEYPPEGPQALFQLTGAPLLTGGLVGGAVIAAALSGGGMTRAPRFIGWGVLVGLAITSGWLGTQWAATASFGALHVESHSFARPLGESLLWLMTASAAAPGFAVGSVTGVLLGAFLGSWRKGHFRWEACEDPRELKRQILGAALMGPGAVLAAGCSVGQGLSAFSLLTFSAPVALLSIFVGAAFGLRQLIVGFAPAE